MEQVEILQPTLLRLQGVDDYRYWAILYRHPEHEEVVWRLRDGSISDDGLERECPIMRCHSVEPFAEIYKLR